MPDEYTDDDLDFSKGRINRGDLKTWTERKLHALQQGRSNYTSWVSDELNRRRTEELKAFIQSLTDATHEVKSATDEVRSATGAVGIATAEVKQGVDRLSVSSERLETLTVRLNTLTIVLIVLTAFAIATPIVIEVWKAVYHPEGPARLEAPATQTTPTTPTAQPPQPSEPEK